MYINSLGMRDEAGKSTAVNSNIAAADNNKKATTNLKTDTESSFPTTMEKAVESRIATLGEDTETTRSINEALARLQSDPEWEDVGTALSAMYKNQQQMQVQMSLLSAGYSSGLSGLSSYYGYGLGNNAASAYNSADALLLGSSIFGNMLL